MIEERCAVAFQITVTVTISAFGEHHIGALLPLGNQLRDDADRILQVHVHGDHCIAGGVFQAGKQRRFLAEIAREVDQQHLFIDLCQRLGLLSRPVSTAVVDEHDLDLTRVKFQFATHRLMEQTDRLLFIEYRNNQRNFHVSHS
jgi:hypothetical protein